MATDTEDITGGNSLTEYRALSSISGESIPNNAMVYAEFSLRKKR